MGWYASATPLTLPNVSCRPNEILREADKVKQRLEHLQKHVAFRASQGTSSTR
jgi:hypothetical protein